MQPTAAPTFQPIHVAEHRRAVFIRRGHHVKMIRHHTVGNDVAVGLGLLLQYALNQDPREPLVVEGRSSLTGTNREEDGAALHGVYVWMES